MKEQHTVEDICPHCVGGENDHAIEDTKEGYCGVCGGTGRITWRSLGRIV